MNNSNSAFHTLPIIGHHHSPLSQKFGIPRQPNLVAIKSQIRFIAPYDTPDAFVGIEHYSHLWILWQFHHNKAQAHFRPQVRPPRLGGNDKTGVFATRSMYRPSQIGLSVVVLDKVQVIDNQVILHIIGADMVDGTPILDIKPYLPYSDSIDATSPIHTPSQKPVVISQKAQSTLNSLCQTDVLSTTDLSIIQSLIAQDPRVAYRQSEIGTISTIRYGIIDVGFFMNDLGELVIDEVTIIEQQGS